MRKENKPEAGPEPKPEVKAEKVEPTPKEVAPAKVRNLSVEQRIKHYEHACAYEKSKHSEHETVPGHIMARDADDNVIIKDGVPVLDNRRITKHAAIEMDYKVKIDRLKATGKL